GRLIEDGARGLHRALQADVGTDGSAVVGWISAQLEAARQALASDPVLYGQVDGWMKRQAIALVEAHHQRIAAFIERGVRSLGAEGAVHPVEEHAGDDLQFIRVNGTVVGGLAGGAIYGVHTLLRLV